MYVFAKILNIYKFYISIFKYKLVVYINVDWNKKLQTQHNVIRLIFSQIDVKKSVILPANNQRQQTDSKITRINVSPSSFRNNPTLCFYIAGLLKSIIEYFCS